MILTKLEKGKYYYAKVVKYEFNAFKENKRSFFRRVYANTTNSKNINIRVQDFDKEYQHNSVTDKTLLTTTPHSNNCQGKEKTTSDSGEDVHQKHLQGTFRWFYADASVKRKPKKR